MVQVKTTSFLYFPDQLREAITCGDNVFMYGYTLYSRTWINYYVHELGVSIALIIDEKDGDEGSSHERRIPIVSFRGANERITERTLLLVPFDVQNNKNNKAEFIKMCAKYNLTNICFLPIEYSLLLKKEWELKRAVELDYEYSVALDLYYAKHGTHINATDDRLVSSICRPTDIIRYQQWGELLRPDRPRLMTRKHWEFIYICQALEERGMLAKGKRGLGFAVGRETLPSVFASRQCEILATDLDPKNEEAARWNSTGQHSDDLQHLLKPEICDKDTFFSHVRFEYADMNNIQSSLKSFDFCWSSCAMEHLGGIEKGKRFIYNAMECLKPGGFAVHTTDFNLSSNGSTYDGKGTALFREADMREIADTLKNAGHYVEPLDFRLDASSADRVIRSDVFDSAPHFKRYNQGYLFTSIGIIIQKGV